MSKKYKIEHMGRILHTNHFNKNISDDICQEIREKYQEKPKKTLADRNLKKIHNGGTMVNHITGFYIRDLMDKVKLYSAKWSIEEMLQSNDLIRYFYSRILSSKKVYPEKLGLHSNFKTAIRISGGGVVMKPSNFPMKTIDYILNKYNLNNNYYDFSCGWGVRMLSSFKYGEEGIKYYGTDPNFMLVERLIQIHKDYQNVNKVSRFIDIRCQGSEVLVQEWKNKIGLIFSSPPYYCLEDYKIGNQSIKNRTYKEWLKEYVGETLNNCWYYLIKGGYLLINIKNVLKYSILDDIVELINCGKKFKFIKFEKLVNNKRPSSKKKINTDEQIIVAKKLS